MPISAYFQGHGSEVMRQMREKHGAKKGKSIFYATAKSRGEEPKGEMHGGGDVPSTGVYLLKKGETVVAKESDPQLGHGEDVERKEKQGFSQRFRGRA